MEDILASPKERDNGCSLKSTLTLLSHMITLFLSLKLLLSQSYEKRIINKLLKLAMSALYLCPCLFLICRCSGIKLQ